MASGPRMVNKQFNSPIGLYSQQNIQDTLSKQTRVLNNGAVGIDFNAKPSNLANSAVLRMLEEEEQRQRNGQAARYSRGDRQGDPHIRRIDRFIDWPPKTATNDGGQINMNNMYSAQFFKPRTAGTKRIAWPPPAEEGDGQEGESEIPAQRQAAPAHAPVKLIQSPALSRLIPIERESAPVSYNPPQAKVYAPQPPAAQVPQARPVPAVQPRSPQPQLSPLPKAFSPQPPLSPQTQTFPPPFPEPYSTFPRKTQSSFAPVSPRAFAPLSPQSHEPRSLSAVSSQVYAPVPPPSRDFALVSPQPYHSPVSAPSAPFKFGATRDEQPGAPSTYIVPIQFEEPPPSTVTLRPTAPVHQKPAPVVASQPAANSFKGGVNMRGDQKWPPASNKEAMQAENEARISLAKGPACRPRKVKKDYSSFFAKNALPNNYPGYKVPPGTQHYDDASGTSQF